MMLRTARAFAAINPQTRGFHTTRAAAIAVGDSFPDIEVAEDSPGNKVSLSKELSKQTKALVVGVPAAFSPSCSASHIPTYINANSSIPTYVVSVNDPFVMKAWGASIPGAKEAGIRFLADPAAKLTEALEMDYDGSALFGNRRSKRYALYLENGKVKNVFVEPDNTGVKETTADKVLAAIRA